MTKYIFNFCHFYFVFYFFLLPCNSTLLFPLTRIINNSSERRKNTLSLQNTQHSRCSVNENLTSFSTPTISILYRFSNNFNISSLSKVQINKFLQRFIIDIIFSSHEKNANICKRNRHLTTSKLQNHIILENYQYFFPSLRNSMKRNYNLLIHIATFPSNEPSELIFTLKSNIRIILIDKYTSQPLKLFNKVFLERQKNWNSVNSFRNLSGLNHVPTVIVIILETRHKHMTMDFLLSNHNIEMILGELKSVTENLIIVPISLPNHSCNYYHIHRKGDNRSNYIWLDDQLMKKKINGLLKSKHKNVTIDIYQKNRNSITILREKINRLTTKILQNTFLLLESLESKQNDFLLTHSTSMCMIPTFEFGKEANSILSDAYDAFQAFEIELNEEIRCLMGEDENILDHSLKKLFERKRMDILYHLTGESGFLRLYKLQLSFLREYYGTLFENSIHDQYEKNGSLDQDFSLKEKKMNDAILDKASNLSIEGFRASALNAIPFIIQKKSTSKIFTEGHKEQYSYIETMEGLLRDIMDIKYFEQTNQGELKNIKLIEMRLRNSIKIKSVKWYKKLGAKLLVLAINFLQSWVVFQRDKIMANKRDEIMPKFPLF